MRVDYPVRDGEAQSMAQRSLCRFTAEEGLENKCKVRSPHTGSLIGNHEADLAPQRIVFATDMDPTAARCVPNGVAHYVVERTMQQLGAADNLEGQERVDTNVEANQRRPGAEFKSRIRYDLAHQFSDVYPLLFPVWDARFQTREREQLVD